MAGFQGDYSCRIVYATFELVKEASGLFIGIGAKLPKIGRGYTNANLAAATILGSAYGSRAMQTNGKARQFRPNSFNRR